MSSSIIHAQALETLRKPIFDILLRSDMSLISAKKVRIALTNLPDPREPKQTLLQRLQIDINDKASKSVVDALIRECFDAISGAVSTAPPSDNGHSQSNGHAVAAPPPAVPRIALPGLGGIPGSHAPSSQPPPSSGSSTISAAPPSSSTSTKRSRKQEDIISDEEVDIDADTIKRNSSGKKVVKKRKSAANGEPKAPNPNNPFNKPVILDDALSRVCGGKEMPRFMITKQLWVYIKERNLQNPQNKRQILCDSTLTRLFGKETVDSFEMAKLISSHVTKKD